MRSWWLVLAGCGRFGFAAHEAPADATSDAPVDAAADATPDALDLATTCVAPGDGYAFPSATVACAGWGTLAQQKVTVVQNGALQISPMANIAQASATCTATGVPFTTAGIFLHLGAMPDTTAIGGVISFQLGAGTDTFFFDIFAEQGMISPSSDGATVASVPFDPATMRYLRLRPDGGRVAFETSPDAHAWRLLGHSTAPSPTTVSVELGYGMAVASPTPGTAHWVAIDVCP